MLYYNFSILHSLHLIFSNLIFFFFPWCVGQYFLISTIVCFSHSHPILLIYVEFHVFLMSHLPVLSHSYIIFLSVVGLSVLFFFFVLVYISFGVLPLCSILDLNLNPIFIQFSLLFYFIIFNFLCYYWVPILQSYFEYFLCWLFTLFHCSIAKWSSSLLNDRLHYRAPNAMQFPFFVLVFYFSSFMISLFVIHYCYFLLILFILFKLLFFICYFFVVSIICYNF